MIPPVNDSLSSCPFCSVILRQVIPLEILTRGKSLSSMVRRFTAMFYCLFLPPLFDRLGGFLVFMCQARAPRPAPRAASSARSRALRISCLLC